MAGAALYVTATITPICSHLLKRIISKAKITLAQLSSSYTLRLALAQRVSITQRSTNKCNRQIVLSESDTTHKR